MAYFLRSLIRRKMGAGAPSHYNESISRSSRIENKTLVRKAENMTLQKIHASIHSAKSLLIDFYSAYLDRPSIRMITALIVVFIVLRIFSIIVRKIGEFLGGTVLPAEGLVNQGMQVDQSVEKLNLQIGNAIDKLFKDLKRDFDQSYVSRINELKNNLSDSQGIISNAFGAEPDRNKLSLALREQENICGELILSMYRQLSSRSKNLLSLRSIRNSFQFSVQRLIDSYPRFYLVFQIDENLACEPEDSYMVKFAKVIRRAQRAVDRWISWLSLPLNRRGQPKMAKVRKIQWKMILVRRLRSDLDIVLAKWLGEVEAHLSKIRDALKESARILQFNLETAAAELAETNSDEEYSNISDLAKENVLGGFDRVMMRLDAVLKEADEDWNTLQSSLLEKSSRLISQVRRDCDVADTVGAIVTEKLERAEESLSKLKIYLKKRSRVEWIHLVKLMDIMRGNLRRAGAKLGLKKPEGQEWIGALDNATVKYSQQQIPPLYKRVFRFEPLGDEELFVSRDESLAKIEDAKRRWAKGLSCSIGIYGPGGSGKTSLVTCAQQRYFEDSKVFFGTLDRYCSDGSDFIKWMASYFQVKSTSPLDNISALAALINSDIGPAVAIVEGANLLYTRSMNGFKVLDSLFDLMTQTRPTILWIVTMSEEAWRYLDAVKNINIYFTYAINARNMDREDLERVIMVRHEITGYKLEYVQQKVNPNMFHFPKRKNPDDIQKDLQKIFFDALHDATDGNLFASIYYWLCAIEFHGEEKICIQPFKPLEAGVIRSLNQRQAACLVAALQQGVLWPETYSKIFRTSHAHAAMCLNELREKTILLQLDQDRFVPNPIVIPIATRVLRERNLIYA